MPRFTREPVSPGTHRWRVQLRKPLLPIAKTVNSAAFTHDSPGSEQSLQTILYPSPVFNQTGISLGELFQNSRTDGLHRARPVPQGSIVSLATVPSARR